MRRQILIPSELLEENSEAAGNAEMFTSTPCGQQPNPHDEVLIPSESLEEDPEAAVGTLNVHIRSMRTNQPR